MAAVTVRLVSVCDGGDHATIRVTKGVSRDIPMVVSELRGSITQEDLEGFAKVVMKLVSEGKTLAQFKSSMQSGVTVTV